MVISPESESKEYTLKHRAQVTLLLIVFGYVLLVADYPTYAQKVYAEIQDNVSLIGDENAHGVINRAKHIYALLERMLPPIDGDSLKGAQGNSFNVGGDSLDWLRVSPYDLWHKFLLLMYQIFFRFSLLLWWGGALLPLTIALIFQGYNERKIKMYEFQVSSAVKQNIWIRMSAFFSFMLSLYLILPYAAGFGVLYPPVAMVMSAIIAKNIITHITKTL